MEFAGREWDYTYRELFDFADEKRIKSIADSTLKQYSTLTKKWTVELNSEWTCRAYLAIKMILNATVQLRSLEFAKKVGLRTANPYYEYYATLSILRAVVYTLPTQEWSEGKLIKISHSKAIEVAFDWLAKFDKTKSEALKQICWQLKAQRELISYSAPASGDANLGSNYNLIELLTILAEVAQFNSELLEASVNKNADPSLFHIEDDFAHQVVTVEIDDFSFSDDEDYRRLSYIARKAPSPRNLACFMTEGQVEDFFGAWDGDDENDESFTSGSSSDWQIIFDIP
ncbi:MAG: hypothetical protein ACRYFR_16085 [Janthinobacterium lividum]